MPEVNLNVVQKVGVKLYTTRVEIFAKQNFPSAGLLYHVRDANLYYTLNSVEIFCAFGSMMLFLTTACLQF